MWKSLFSRYLLTISSLNDLATLSLKNHSHCLRICNSNYILQQQYFEYYRTKWCSLLILIYSFSEYIKKTNNINIASLHIVLLLNYHFATVSAFKQARARSKK